MNPFTFFRSRKPPVADRHATFYRRPAERVMDLPDPVEKIPGKPIGYYLLVPFKVLFGFIANLFLAILGLIAVGMKMPLVYLFLVLGSVVGIGVLHDVGASHLAYQGTVFGAQVALVLFAIVCCTLGIVAHVESG